MMIPDDDLSTELVLKIARRAGRLSLPSKRSLHVHDQNKNRHTHSTLCETPYYMLKCYSYFLNFSGFFWHWNSNIWGRYASGKKGKMSCHTCFWSLNCFKKSSFFNYELPLFRYVYTKLFVFKLKGTKTLKESFWI